jgi:hypothetical protein
MGDEYIKVQKAIAVAVGTLVCDFGVDASTATCEEFEAIDGGYRVQIKCPDIGRVAIVDVDMETLTAFHIERYDNRVITQWTT